MELPGTGIAFCVDQRAAEGATLKRYWQEVDRNVRDLVDPAARLPGKAP